MSSLDAIQGPSVRRQELADFLRSRRERITPEQAGLPSGPRRRTPGLRREEVAQLSAVGVTWYTWLEQARDIQVSAQVLDALARALLMDPSERAHLFALGGAADPMPEEPCPTVTPALRAMLERLEPFPACVQNVRYDILAYNRTFSRLLCDMDSLPREDRNCLWLAFTNDQWRAAMGDLEDSIRVMVAKFRAGMAEHLAEPAWKALLARLKTLPEFRALWDRFEVVGASSKTTHIDNPHVGHLKVMPTSLWLGPQPGGRLLSYVPEDDESRARLEQLRLVADLGPAADEKDQLAAHLPGLAGPVRLGDVSQRESRSDRDPEPSRVSQLRGQRKRVKSAAGVAAAEPHAVLLRTGKVGDRDHVVRVAGEVDQLGEDAVAGHVKR